MQNSGVFRSASTAYVLTFSLIMLNTVRSISISLSESELVKSEVDYILSKLSGGLFLMLFVCPTAASFPFGFTRFL